MNAIKYIKDNLTKDIIINLIYQQNVFTIDDTGTDFRCCCPLHGGDNPTAFTWNYENGLWYCFTGDCGGGDVFDFIADVYDMNIEMEFLEVVKKTAEVLGFDISHLEMGERADRNTKELRDWMDYVAKKVPSLQQEFNLRSLGEMYHMNTYRNFTPETLEHFNITYNRTFNRVQVPLYNSSGMCIGASLRRIEDDKSPKWLHKPKHMKTGEILYNLNNINEHQESIMIVEGPFDVANFYQVIDENNIVAQLGSHLTELQSDLICNRFTDVTVAYDADEAGKLATFKAIDMLAKKTNLMIIDMFKTDLHDIGEIVKDTHLPFCNPWQYSNNHKR